jgi:hypothetical protein
MSAVGFERPATVTFERQDRREPHEDFQVEFWLFKAENSIHGTLISGYELSECVVLQIRIMKFKSTSFSSTRSLSG